jgi:uncharacterized protein YecT (DUF1311 family)
MKIRLIVSLIGLIGLGGCPFPANSTDCSKASTPIDRALCGDSLRDNDSRLNTILTDIHSYLSAAEAQALLVDQRAWLKQRDSACSSLTDQDLGRCLLKQTDERTNDLLERFDKDHPTNIVTGTFAVGDHKLTVGDRQITENGKPVIQNTDDNGNGSVDVYDGFHSKDVDAVAVLVFDGGTLDCPTDYVLWARHGGPLQVIAGDGEQDCPNAVFTTPDGFGFSGVTDEISGRRDDYMELQRRQIS